MAKFIKGAYKKPDGGAQAMSAGAKAYAMDAPGRESRMAMLASGKSIPGPPQRANPLARYASPIKGVVKS